MLRKLLDAGPDIQIEDRYTLWYAIRREHTDMAEMMLCMEVDKERGIPMKMKYARDNGLESMAELLARWLQKRWDGEPIQDL